MRKIPDRGDFRDYNIRCFNGNCVWGLSIVMDYLGYAHIHSIYAILCCLFILTNQREQMKRRQSASIFTERTALGKDKAALRDVKGEYRSCKPALS